MSIGIITVCDISIKIENENLWRGNWPPILCFVVTFCWFGIFACMGVDIHHDGIMLKPATDVANGQVLFRDTFTQYGALTTFIQALALKVFGSYLVVIRLTTVFFYSLSAVLLYYIWRNFLSSSFFWITYGMFLIMPPFYGWIFNPWSSIYALFFMLLTNICMINFIRRGSVLCLWGAGVSSALTFWCRQPNGIVMYLALFLFFAICLALERKSWKKILNNLSIYTAVYVICFMCFLVYLGLNDALADWYFQSIRFMFSFGIEGREATSLFKCLFPRSVFIVFPIVTLSVLCISIYSLVNRRHDSERPMGLMLIVTAIIGLASWHQYFPVPCLRHFYWASIPMLGFYAFAIQEIVNFSIKVMPLHFARYFGKLYFKFTAKMPVPHLLSGLSKLLLIVILLLPFYSTATRMAKDMPAKLMSISGSRVFYDSPLKYMLLSDSEYQFFKAFQSVMNRLPPEFANSRGINFTNGAFFSLYFPNGNNFFPMYVNFGNSVYPDYTYQAGRVLAECRPIVISHKKLEFPSYSLFSVIETHKYPIYFYLPNTKASPDEL